MLTRSGRTLQQGKITSHYSATLNTQTRSEPVTINTYTDSTMNNDNGIGLQHTSNMASASDQRSVTNSDLKELIVGMESRLTTKFDQLQIELNELKDRVTKNEVDIQGLQTSVDFNAGQTDNIVKKLIPEVVQGFDKCFADFEKQNMLRELHDRKYNLLFYGVPQGEDETHADLDPKMREVFQSDFGIADDEINGLYIVNIHRLPRRNTPGVLDGQQREKGPDPIIVRFGCMADLNTILEGQRRRPFMRDRKPVMAYTDLPAKMKQERGKLVQHAKRLRQDGNITRIRTIGLQVLLEYKRKGFGGGNWRKFIPTE